MTSTIESSPARLRRRDAQKEQTRFDLALAAFEQAVSGGLASVRVPQIAEAVGVSPRTFNNYFPSKEAAIVWPATLRMGQLTANLAARPAGEVLAEALVESIAGLYRPDAQDGIPRGWLEGFRSLVAQEPALQGEYLRVQAAGERAFAEAIAARIGAASDDLRPMILAGVVIAAERAAVLHWSTQTKPSARLAAIVRDAVRLAVSGAAPADLKLL